ncbi:MAG: aldo/keto reductase [bacterium]|nr:aldo/keto reductase [bacterium]
MNRREFIKGTVAAGGMLALPITRVASETTDVSSAVKAKMPQGILGRTGEKVSRLGVGCWIFGTERMSVDDSAATLHRAVELGVTYIDTAPNYGNAEEKMGQTIKEIRDKIFLVTKTEEPSYEGTWRLLRQSLKRLQTDRLDLVHIHSIGSEDIFADLNFALGDKGALGALREAKKQGVIRFIGASGHHYPSRFHRVLEYHEIDVLMNAVNFVAQHTYDFENKVWCRARQQNLGLAAMKVLGGAGPGGKGFQLPEECYELAIRYALSIAGVSCAVIGMGGVAELERAAATVAKAQPLSEEETFDLYRRGMDLLTGNPSWHTLYGRPVT